MMFEPYLAPCTKTNSKWIKYVNVGPEILKCLEENKGGNLCEIGLGNDFSTRTPKPREEQQ